MKKIIIAMILIIAPFTAFSKFNAGISVGYNATELKSNWDDINSNLKSGFQFGIFARIGDKLFLQPEILYASRGGFTEFSGELSKQITGNGTEVHTGMFQIPVMLGAKILDGDMLGVNIQAGPVLSIITNTGLAGVDEVFADKNFEDFTYGVQFGAGIDFLSFALNVRYEYALSEIYKGSYGNQNFNAKANTFLVTLGWKLL
jgi:hypothetical protein